MKERKIIKIRTDMYYDTKFKIIDTMEERDLINYVWTRLLVLSGKVNKRGKLYLSATKAYTAETLALEFNRPVEKVKLALKVLIELEMLQLSKDKVYIVKNFNKYQDNSSQKEEKTKMEKSEEKESLEKAKEPLNKEEKKQENVAFVNNLIEPKEKKSPRKRKKKEKKSSNKTEVITDINEEPLGDNQELDGIFTLGEVEPKGKVIKTFSFADS